LAIQPQVFPVVAVKQQTLFLNKICYQSKTSLQNNDLTGYTGFSINPSIRLMFWQRSSKESP
jgi:hypothetical protein